MKKMLCIPLLVSLLLVGLMSLPLSAAAADGTDQGVLVSTQTIFMHPCNVSGCLLVTGEIRHLVTPSGNDIFSADITRTITYRLTGEVSTSTIHRAGLKRDGMFQVLRETITTDFRDCTTTEVVHYANGQFQFDDITTSCSAG